MAQTILLPSWTQLAHVDDADFPLLSSALLIAKDEYPHLDAQRYLAHVNSHAAHLQPIVDRIALSPLKMAAINRYLFNEIGYSGHRSALNDPRTCYLNEVVDRRIGNAQSLAVVQIEVARRLGIPLEGLSLPGHFFVRLPVESGILIMDPFNRGRPLGIDEIHERIRPLLSGHQSSGHVLSRLLDPAPHRGILIGMLEQLYAHYSAQHRWDKAARCADRILRLRPNQAEAIRNRGLAYLALDHQTGARQDLEQYLALQPGAEDALTIRDQLISLSAHPSTRH